MIIVLLILNKEVTKLRKKLAKTSRKLVKAGVKERESVVEEVKKVARLNRQERKYDHRIAGSKSINKTGYTQKYIDLLQKRRSGQITQKEFEEGVLAIPKQYRNTKYETFTTETQIDITESRRNSKATGDIHNGRKPEPEGHYPDYEQDME